ncbi:MAG: glycosyltransferase [Planctomycetota bacterium]
MRVLIQTFGSAGDIYPFKALGQALRDRGHDVSVIVNEKFVSGIEGAGLEAIQVGEAAAYHAATNDPNLWHPSKGLGVVMDGVRLSLKPAIEAIRERLTDDTVLVASSLGLAARMVRELHDVPLATVHLAPMAFKTMHRVQRFPAGFLREGQWRWAMRLQWWLIEKISDSIIRKWLDGARREYGLEPATNIFFEWLHSPDIVLGLFPDWFGPRQPDWPDNVHLCSFARHDSTDELEPELEKWLQEGEKPIVFTHGSAQRRGDRFFKESADAAARLGRRAILITSNAESMPATLPDGVRHEPYVPFGALLPRSAALVSHGGVGTCAQGLAAGIPHLVSALSFDQFDNASRIEDLGAGAALPAKRYTGERAANALRALLENGGGTNGACEKAAAKLAKENGAETAAKHIESLGRR